VSAVSASAGAMVYGNMCKRNLRSDWCSPRVQLGLEGRAESMATLTGGGAEAELVDRGAALVLRASGLQGSTRGVAGETHKGSERSKVTRRRAIPAAGRVTCDGAPVKFRHRRGPRSGQQARGWSWARGGAAARLWESCGAAEQGALLRWSKVGVTTAMRSSAQ
jgi:hypothetical protein